jgi:SAM-dependent methyltransferase
VTKTVVNNFFDEWSIYDQVLDHNYMYHDEIYGNVRRILADRYETRPFLLLGLVGGSTRRWPRALQGRSVSRYVGYDLSDVALAHARRNLTGLGCPVELHRGDLLESLRIDGEKFDVVFTSFALHHLAAAQKSTFFQLAYSRLNQDGILLLIDTVRDDGEDRKLYLDRYCAWLRSEFKTLSPDALDLLCDHIRSNDFPETLAALDAMATRAGFSTHVEINRFRWHHTCLFARSGQVAGTGHLQW